MKRRVFYGYKKIINLYMNVMLCYYIYAAIYKIDNLGVQKGIIQGRCTCLFILKKIFLKDANNEIKYQIE